MKYLFFGSAAMIILSIILLPLYGYSVSGYWAFAFPVLLLIMGIAGFKWATQ